MANTTDRYRVDTSDPQIRTEERIRQLERQVADLQSARGLRRSTMSGGTIRVADDSGNEVARIGEEDWSGPGGISAVERIIWLSSASGGIKFLASAESGLVWPPSRSPWYPVLAPAGGTTYVDVTSGSFTSTHRTIYTQSADSVRARLTIGVDPATTGELRLESGGPHQTVVFPLPDGTLDDYQFDWWLGPDGVGVGMGVELSIDIQVRRTSGSGTIHVHQPPPLMITDNLMIRADVSGEAAPV